MGGAAGDQAVCEGGRQPGQQEDFFLLGVCCNDTMVFYGPTIAAQVEVGVSTEWLAILPWIGFSLGYALSSPLMAKLGRVTQFVSFALLMSTSLFALATATHLLSWGWDSTALKASFVTSLLVATTAYGMGVGAVPYTQVGELFTPEHRTLGSCLAQLVRSATVFLAVKMTPYVIQELGLSALFLGHALVCAILAIFTFLCVPE